MNSSKKRGDLPARKKEESKQTSEAQQMMAAAAQEMTGRLNNHGTSADTRGGMVRQI
jgi:RecA/RadA recombinase